MKPFSDTCHIQPKTLLGLRRKIGMCALLLCCACAAHAQHISGYVMSGEKKPIGGASVILQTPDSVFVESGITDANGRFTLKHLFSAYRLLVQHLAYRDKTVRVSKGDKSVYIQMEEKSIQLAEVNVLAKPPLVQMATNGAFLYNVDRLREVSAASNAYELIADIPGILKNNDSYHIVGAASTNIILNGRRSSMTQSDLEHLSQMTPLDDLKSIEVFYNTPAIMGVNGASINVNIKKKRSEQTRLSGELYTTAYVGRKFYEVGGFRMGLSGKTWSFDLGYGLGSLNKIARSKSVFNHTVDGVLHTIESPLQTVRQDLFSHRVNGRFSVDLPAKAQLTLSYDVKFTDRTIVTSIPLDDSEGSHSENNGRISGNEAMHVATAEYVRKALTIGGDFVFYDYKTAQDLTAAQDGEEADLTSDNRQRVYHGSLYANHHAPLWQGTLSYGGSLTAS